MSRDDLERAILDYRTGVDHAEVNHAHRRIVALLDELEREAAALRRDAERLRFILTRFELATGPREWTYHHFMFPDEAEVCLAAIDAAIARSARLESDSTR